MSNRGFYKDGRTLIDDLPPEVAEGVREYGRRSRSGEPQDDWTRESRAIYENHRLAVVPGARERTRSYYAERVGRPVNTKWRKHQ